VNGRQIAANIRIVCERSVVVKICSAHEFCVQYGKVRTFKSSKVSLRASSDGPKVDICGKFRELWFISLVLLI
jgi:hypothetical protein